MIIEFSVIDKGNVKLSDHFSAIEFMCPHCKYVKVDTQLLAKLEELRKQIGNIPIKITSGFRCPEYNKQIGGYYKSRHIYGDAADFRPWNKDEFDYGEFVKTVLNIFPRVGVYPQRFVHADLYKTQGNLYWYRDLKGEYHYTRDSKTINAIAKEFEDHFRA